MSEKQSPEPFRPVGTITLLGIYFLLLILLWGNVFMTMLSRGVTR